jgi:hypothetical protein
LRDVEKGDMLQIVSIVGKKVEIKGLDGYIVVNGRM